MENSKLEVLIPKDTEIDIASVLRSSDGLDHADPATLVEQRSLLYFDENLPVYIALGTPYQDEARLKSFIARHAISLEVLAYGFQQRPSGGPDGSKESSPSRNEDVLWSGVIDAPEEPITIVREGNESVSGRHVLVIWKSTIPLCRPRMRLQSPMIVFKPSATLRPLKDENNHKLRDTILPSGVPGSINLLESLKGDPTLRGEVPRLPASRLSGIAPQSYDRAADDTTLTINAPKAFMALPAISSRVRYSKSNSYNRGPSVIAVLDIETSPFSHESIKIIEIDMLLSDGSSEQLGSTHIPTLPLTCRPKDNPLFLFSLIPNDSTPTTSTRTLLINVHATVLASPTCHPTIHMRWKTTVDFSTALNPTFGAPGQSMQRARRPSSLSRTPVPTTNVPSQPIQADPAPKPISTNNQSHEQNPRSTDFGVSITFTAPKTVYVGNPFTWDVLVLNRSSKPRQLLLTVIPKRKKNVHHSTKTSSASAAAATALAKTHHSDIAEAVIDENILYAMQRNAAHEHAEVVSLSTDVRVGILPPSSCLSTEIRFLPLTRGYLSIEAVRVMDVVENKFVDVKEVPDIFAVG